MTRKIARWVVVILLLGTISTGLFGLRMLMVGADSFRTTIKLQYALETQELEAFGAALDEVFELTCRNRNSDETCVRWRIGALGGDSVYIEYRDFSDKTIAILINSFPYYPLYIGPATIKRIHKRVGRSVTSTLGDNVASINLRRLPE